MCVLFNANKNLFVRKRESLFVQIKKLAVESLTEIGQIDVSSPIGQ